MIPILHRAEAVHYNSSKLIILPWQTSKSIFLDHNRLWLRPSSKVELEVTKFSKFQKYTSDKKSRTAPRIILICAEIKAKISICHTPQSFCNINHTQQQTWLKLRIQKVSLYLGLDVLGVCLSSRVNKSH